ncbi:bifunctional peptidase and arginyl-hydroxylase JMJD5 [Epargyreus clarus]|uniref:bifunctional peptidase and arginyl-hydroxylase JMJD5 n=1 Tax=Epargyreus clarus TaxID=520877 RepID=UPI003C2DC487
MSNEDMYISDIFEEIKSFKPKISLDEISELDMTCKSVIENGLNDANPDDPNRIGKIKGVLDYMHEQVNIGNWKEVQIYIRKTITIASYVRLLVYLKSCDAITEPVVRESMKIIDFGIVFGSPIDNDPTLLQRCASLMNSAFVTEINIPSSSNANSQFIEINTESNKYDATRIEVLDCPSMEHFYNNYIIPGKPVILDNCISHWPALNKWNDRNYLLKVAGLRTVSVELGKDYTDSEWTQKMMTIEDFIKNHVYQNNGPTGYLAQYQLFEQIPELKDDIFEPDYCSFTDTNDPVDVMAWYGPKGTLSPLHHDPKRNLLTQVVGEKQIFLFSPEDSEYLYPHEHELLTNTARVDPRNPNYILYPKYRQAKTYYCVLRPGQMLYIPPKWWHFVESLSVSFSVSFWWT